MYELHNGPIQSHLVVRHRCDNPSCIEISHLETGTQFDNVRDAWERNRAHGNIGEANGRAKLTEAQVLNIRSLYKPKCRTHGAAALARNMGVHPDVILDAVHRRTWSHI